MLARLRSLIRSIFRRDALEREMDAEHKFHMERRAEDLARRGQSAVNAQRNARVEFAGVEKYQEACREARGANLLEDLVKDARFAARTLRKNPGFTAIAALTLALGIGANTAIFSMVEAVLLRPLPYPEGDRLAMVWEDVRLPQYQSARNTPAPGNYVDWKTQNTVFEDMAAEDYRSWSLTGSGEAMRVTGEGVTANLFSVMRVYPALGRAFTPEEDHPGAEHEAIIAYGLWKERFGGDAGIIGRSISLDEIPYTVVGVMPAGYHFSDPDDQLWVPIAMSPERLANRGSHFLNVIARLKAGVTFAQAQSAMTVIGQRLTAQYPDSNTGVGVNVVPLGEQITGELRRPILVLAGVVGFLLLMVCANVANLLLARASSRARELAIRSAVGASRARLIRQLLVESVLLSAVGGALGIAIAYAGLGAIRQYASSMQFVAYSPNGRGLSDVQLNGLVLAFSAGVTLLAGLLFGLLPAFNSSRRDVISELREGAHESASGARMRTRAVLVVAEMALGVIVLAGAGLLLRTFVGLQRIALGFQPERVLTLRVIPRGPRYKELSQLTAFYRQVSDRLNALPGVRAAAGITFLPLSMQGRTTGIGIEDQGPTSPAQLPFVDFRSVSPGYFAAMQIPLLRGRDVSWNDTQQAPLIAVVSETMAQKFWANSDAIGKRFKLGPVQGRDPWITVIGVAGNVHQLQLQGVARPAIYLAATQDAGTGDTLRDWTIQTAGDPEPLAPAVRSAIWAVDANLPISRTQTMEQVRSAVLGPQQVNFSLVGLFGIVALVLAAVGLYGVTAYSVAQRTHEIGIRVALGARRAEVLRLVLGQGAKLAMLGLAIGTAAALALSQFLSSLLYGVTARDPLTFAGVAALLAGVALAASYIPARRAMRVDPMIALRHE